MTGTPQASYWRSSIVDGATDTVDIRNAFLERTEPNPVGGLDSLTATACTAFRTGRLADTDVDGGWDTVTMVGAGQQICFDVSRKLNSTVAPTAVSAS